MHSRILTLTLTRVYANHEQIKLSVNAVCSRTAIFCPSPRKCPSCVVALLTLTIPKHVDALVPTPIIMPLDISVGSVV